MIAQLAVHHGRDTRAEKQQHKFKQVAVAAFVTYWPDLYGIYQNWDVRKHTRQRTAHRL